MINIEPYDSNVSFSFANFATTIVNSTHSSYPQIFSANATSVDNNICGSKEIEEQEIAVLVSSQSAADATGSITLQSTSECGSQRISYSVFRTDALFLTPDTTTSNDYAVGSVIIGVRAVTSGALMCTDRSVKIKLQQIWKVFFKQKLMLIIIHVYNLLFSKLCRTVMI